MKKFLKYILIFFLLITIVDIITGFVGRYLNSHAKGGDTKSHFHIAYEMTDSVLIFGSSRAIHHYDPKILEDTLGISVYNCGLDGNGIIFNYARLMSIITRYKPQMIIYDVIPSFDMAHDDYSKYLNWQKRLYNDIPEIREIFYDIDWSENVKMLSNLYTYNTNIIQMLSDNINPQQNVAYHGFKPLNETIDYEIAQQLENPQKWDDLKLKYFRKFIENCQKYDIKLIFSFSPWYKALTSDIYNNFISLCNEYDLIIIDMYANPLFSTNREFFADASHLNAIGAEVFSKEFAHILKERLHSLND